MPSGESSDDPGLHAIDQENVRAYELSVEADRLLAAGRVEEGRRVIERAAAVSKEYEIRARFFGVQDTRKIQVSKTIRKIVVPFLMDAGFTLQFGQKWSEGGMFQRLVPDWEHSVSIGRTKFGHGCGVLAACWRDPRKVEYFNWRPVGMLSGTLAYKTQGELEAACQRWCELMSAHLFPWFALHEDLHP
jgi:hypothetical protein